MTIKANSAVRTLLFALVLAAGLTVLASIFASPAHADGGEWARPVQLAANTGANSDFGSRKAPVPGASTYHKGQDFGAKGTNPPLFAMADGTVSSVKRNNGGAGNMLTIDMGECSSIYMHMETIFVGQGDHVTRGQQVGTVGSTGIGSGEHLHLGMKCNGGDYTDPIPVLKSHGIDPYDANDNLGGPAPAPAPEPEPAPAPAPEVAPAPAPEPTPAPAVTDIADADKFVSVDILNVRATPDTTRDRTDKLTSGTKVTVTGTVESQDPYGDGRKTWFQTTSGQFVWSGGLTDAPVAAPAPEPAPQPAVAPVAPARASSPEEAMAYAATKVAERGWSGKQNTCLVTLWTKESGWRFDADNPNSSAYGIPQALPGRKMASAGADWKTNPETQVNWGLDYIDGRYGTPCKALAHSDAVNWY